MRHSRVRFSMVTMATILLIDIGWLGVSSVYAFDEEQPIVVAQMSTSQSAKKPGVTKNPATNTTTGQSAPSKKTKTKASPKKALFRSLSVSPACVNLPYEFTAQGANLTQGQVLCKTDCKGQAQVETKLTTSKITCAYKGLWNPAQSCQVGVVVGSFWNKKTIQTCMASKQTEKTKLPSVSRKNRTSFLTTAPFGIKKKDELGKTNGQDVAGNVHKKRIDKAPPEGKIVGSGKNIFGAKVRKHTETQNKLAKSDTNGTIWNTGAVVRQPTDGAIHQKRGPAVRQDADGSIHRKPRAQIARAAEDTGMTAPRPEIKGSGFVPDPAIGNVFGKIFAPGGTIFLLGKNFGNVPGTVYLQVDGSKFPEYPGGKIPLTVLKWQHNQVETRVPKPMTGPVFRAGSSVVITTAFNRRNLENFPGHFEVPVETRLLHYSGPELSNLACDDGACIPGTQSDSVSPPFTFYGGKSQTFFEVGDLSGRDAWAIELTDGWVFSSARLEKKITGDDGDYIRDLNPPIQMGSTHWAGNVEWLCSTDDSIGYHAYIEVSRPKGVY